MKCSYCEEDPILISGKNYCEKHIYIFDSSFFERALQNLLHNKKKMEDFFEWAFETKTPKLSDLQKWHGKIPRPEKKHNDWGSEGIYVNLQDFYIWKIAQEYLKNPIAHPPHEMRLARN